MKVTALASRVTDSLSVSNSLCHDLGAHVCQEAIPIGTCWDRLACAIPSLNQILPQANCLHHEVICLEDVDKADRVGVDDVASHAHQITAMGGKKALLHPRS